MIKAEIVAHSISPQGEQLFSVLATFPRIILAEVNTHRMLSKNTASSRAIPFKKMVQSVKDNPFIPLAWQKDHPGMQGTEYLDPNTECSLVEFIATLYDTLNTYAKDSKEYEAFAIKIRERVELVETLLIAYKHKVKSIIGWWLFARDKVVEAATLLYVLNVTKQLCNRLLETFMWTTMLITGPLEQGWDNFFNLRCPNYQHQNGKIFKSWKDLVKDAFNTGGSRDWVDGLENYSTIDRLKSNKGAAEIHMMALAECIWDAFNKSTPKQLKAGEWHIPFGDKITDDIIKPFLFQNHETSSEKDEIKVKVSTAMGARTSYTIIGEEKDINIETLINLDNRLVNQNPPHSSPMEHCSRCMTEIERHQFVKGEIKATSKVEIDSITLHANGTHSAFGWCRNFRGFIPYRHIIETNNG